ncbi:MAG TPA: EF-P lysine aminoacylase EpmA [Pirellulaceae bacterium]|nr:EF-P lysine aminoacylase EpmA [Pirellulaceae bacterium]HMP68716.1 EF-P lysine aminoacylase EpmA [Pirellulaceae bacterium]
MRPFTFETNHMQNPRSSLARSAQITDVIKLRAAWMAKVRQYFDGLGFLEVQTPILCRDTVVDRYIDPLTVQVDVQGQGNEQFYMQTSPEFCMKRLLVHGAQAIYALTPVFRAGETGAKHNIEFTMLEWYRVGDNYQAGMDLVDDFAQKMLQRPPATRLSYRETFIRFAGVDPFHVPHELRQDQVAWDEVLNQLMADKIEPALQSLSTVILYDWPANQAALARTRMVNESNHTYEVAERFELYVDGVELANGYHELTDPNELVRRNQANNQLRALSGRALLPVNSRLLEAMRLGLPPCSGTALGFERLLMVATGCDRISQVTLFSPDDV